MTEYAGLWTLTGYVDVSSVRSGVSKISGASSCADATVNCRTKLQSGQDLQDLGDQHTCEQLTFRVTRL